MPVTKEQILEVLRTNDRAICRALVVLNQNQTSDEQRDATTKHHNGEGFRPSHAHMGTSMALQFQRKNYLSPKQIAYWRYPDRKGNMKIGIYWRQLMDAAERKENQKQLDAAQKKAEADQVAFNFGANVVA
jgi:hypothetical protein